MPTATMHTSDEFTLGRYAWVFNRLKDLGILTDTLVTSVTSISDLIADVYTAASALGNQEALMLARVFEQGIRLMEAKVLITDVLAAALTTVNTASATTDLRYLISSVLSDTGNIDVTLASDPGMDLGFAYAVTG